MKTLNIELNVRRMETQNILTTSTLGVDNTTVSDTEGRAAERGGVATSVGDGGVAPVRAGF